MCLNCFITSACERNGIVGALRSSQSYTVVILSSLYLGMKSAGLWTSVLCVGRKETRAMITFQLCLSAVTLAGPPLSTSEMSGKREDPEPGRSLAVEVVTAKGTAQNPSVGCVEGLLGANWAGKR